VHIKVQGVLMFAKSPRITATKRLAQVGGAAAAALLATLAINAPAKADIAQCPTNGACGWFDGNYSGTFGYWTSSTSYLAGYNDNLSSVSNERATTIGWWTNSGYSGDVFQQTPNSAGYFTWPDWRNDSFSSLYIYAF
jgi:hypothetical protein